jgi:general L-amino acid transport system substrate-binding protein
MRGSVFGRSLLIALVAVLALFTAACERDEGGGNGGNNNGGETGGAAGGGNLLATIQEEGTLKCGVNVTVPGFGFDPEGGQNPEGFDIDFCRAFAAAIVGDAEAIELVPVDADNRFISLQNGDYDVLVRNTTWTTTRDGKEGVAFAHPNFYDGQAMMVRAGEFSSIEEMDGANVCVTTGTTTELNLADYFADLGIEATPVGAEDNDQLREAFIAGRCDAWTSDRSQLAGLVSAWPEEEGGPEAMEILDEVMSKEPLAPGVLDAEGELHDVIDAVVNGLILAEELGVDSSNVSDMATQEDLPGPIAALLGAPVLDPETGESAPPDFGYGVENNFMVAAIEAVGNYGEIFERNIGGDSELGLERGINALWTDGGIQYAIPFR